MPLLWLSLMTKQIPSDVDKSANTASSTSVSESPSSAILSTGMENFSPNKGWRLNTTWWIVLIVEYDGRSVGITGCSLFRYPFSYNWICLLITCTTITNFHYTHSFDSLMDENMLFLPDRSQSLHTAFHTWSLWWLWYPNCRLVCNLLCSPNCYRCDFTERWYHNEVPSDNSVHIMILVIKSNVNERQRRSYKALSIQLLFGANCLITVYLATDRNT